MHLAIEIRGSLHIGFNGVILAKILPIHYMYGYYNDVTNNESTILFDRFNGDSMRNSFIGYDFLFPEDIAIFPSRNDGGILRLWFNGLAQEEPASTEIACLKSSHLSNIIDTGWLEGH